MSLIDREEAKRFMTENFLGSDRQIFILRSILDEVKTVDAVEVVRCKDCIFCETHSSRALKSPWHTCSNIEVQDMTTDDFVYIENLNHFCSYGERKVKQNETD